MLLFRSHHVVFTCFLLLDTFVHSFLFFVLYFTLVPFNNHNIFQLLALDAITFVVCLSTEGSYFKTTVL